jgi:hypothetical protein
MAWTAPKTWSVSEVVTASMMNTHVRDNLKYLKGQAGGVAIEDSLTVGSATSPSAPLHAIAASASIVETIRLDNPTNGASNGGRITWRNAAQTPIAALVQAARNGGGTGFLLQFGASSNFTTTDAAVGMTLTSAGLGVGTVAPAAPLHVKGTAASIIPIEASGLTSGTITCLPTSSFTKFVGIIGAARDETGAYNNMFSLCLPSGAGGTAFFGSGAPNQLQAATASGGLTITRVGGTNTYSFSGWAFYI